MLSLDRLKQKGHLTLSARLRLMTISTIAVGFAIFSLVVAVIEFENRKQVLLEEINVLTKIVAERSAAAIAFSDVSAAEENLNSLLLKPDIDYACINSNTKLIGFKKKKTIADILAIESTICQNVPSDYPFQFANDHLFFQQVITLNRVNIGWISVRANLSRIKKNLAAQVEMIFIIAIIAVVLCYVISSVFIELAVKPIKDLKHITQEIGNHNDYSIRATQSSKDETGSLVLSFNNMLDVIEQKDRLKSLFFSNINHEMRSPLNGFLGILQLLESTSLSAEQRSYITIAKSSGEHMLSLINDILDFSKLDEQQLDIENIPCDLHQITLESLTPQAIKAEEKSLDFYVSFANDTPTNVVTDPTRFKQVLTNLISNAIKFCDKGSVNVTFRKQKNALLISIKDTGIGIPEDRLAIIFDPYTQAESSTTRKFGGTGLGLSISKSIVGLLGGDLKVRSSYGEGSEFYFTIPAAQAPSITLEEKLTKSLTQSPTDLQTRSISFHLMTSEDREIGYIHALLSLYAPIEKVSQYQEDLPPPDDSTHIPVIVLPCAKELAPHLLNSISFNNGDKGIVIGPLAIESQFSRLEKQPNSQWRYIAIPIYPTHLADVILTFIGQGTEQAKTDAGTEKNDLLRLNVLVAEDNQTNQMIIRKMLEKLGADVNLVSNGFECLEKVKTGPYDVILMDCDMPVMDGFSATEMIRKQKIVNRNHRPIPIIALTGRTGNDDIERCYQAGMNDHLCKPIELKTLTDMLRNIVR